VTLESSGESETEDVVLGRGNGNPDRPLHRRPGWAALGRPASDGVAHVEAGASAGTGNPDRSATRTDSTKRMTAMLEAHFRDVDDADLARATALLAHY
jgi:hypothetical protein